ncbi:MAG TPA: alternative ribosome rescue aminoacyl-tRNA hydrolase ArfB [Acidimicrobiales bacterium]|nr:alternative ribosome rescue aminoacyl-tRNA hydrolase ArfB [Acidimicrobiales bacterium]
MRSYEAVEDALRVNRSLRIPLGELEWRFTPSGGPGGQHANRSNTRAEVRFDIAGSPSLGPRQRARLLERFGSTIRVAVDDERSQLRNRALAQQRLAARLQAALRVDKERRPTTPTEGARRRRLERKRRRGDQKQLRRPPSASGE